MKVGLNDTTRQDINYWGQTWVWKKPGRGPKCPTKPFFFWKLKCLKIKKKELQTMMGETCNFVAEW